MKYHLSTFCALIISAVNPVYASDSVDEAARGLLQNCIDSVVAGPDGVLVVRYHLLIDEKIDGIPAQRRAPGLMIFLQIESDWKVVTHADFASNYHPETARIGRVKPALS